MNKNVKVIALVLVAVLVFVGGFCLGKTNGFEINVNYNSAGGTATEGGSAIQVDIPSTETPAVETPTEAPTEAAPVVETPTEAPTEAPTQAAPTQAPSNDKPAQEKADKPASGMPTAKNDVINFYKKAVDDVQKNGKAGYIKKEWQAIGNLNVTGNGTVDGIIEKTVGNYATTEENAEDQVCPKGDQKAKDYFPAFSLTDYSKVKSATCTKASNGNYNVTIVLNEEDTPRKGKSFIGQATNSILYWEDIESELQNLSSVVKGYDNVHVLYKTYTFEAEITPDGKFVSLKHTANVDITIGMAKVLFLTLENKSAHMDNYCTYTNFEY